MKFTTKGTFQSETLIDIVQRAVACLQDAGAERVSGVSLYVTVVDRHGVPCPLCLDGETLKQLDLDVAGLALAMPPARLSVGKPQTGPTARPAVRSNQRRRCS